MVTYRTRVPSPGWEKARMRGIKSDGAAHLSLLHRDDSTARGNGGLRRHPIALTLILSHPRLSIFVSRSLPAVGRTPLFRRLAVETAALSCTKPAYAGSPPRLVSR